MIMIEKNIVYNMDCVEGLKTLPDNCIDCCVTSPPYWNLRDYGVNGQLGNEPSPKEYVSKMTEVFREVYRVLKQDGTLWINIGDTYNGTKLENTNAKWSYINSDSWYKKQSNEYKRKDLIGIPWMVAFALRDDVGFYLRQDIIWDKSGNCMPESVTDRCTKAHEYIFLFAKSEKYYFDYEAIQDMAKYAGDDRGSRGDKRRGTECNSVSGVTGEYRNKRSVWHVNTKPDLNAHFAVYPEELIRPCILAGCPKYGIVLDPFMGSGTTAAVALKLDRNYIGFELNPEYIKIIERKTKVQKELFT